MKKIGFLMFAVVSAVFMFSMQSCNNDESEDPGNYFNYDGKDYLLGSGYNYGYSYLEASGRINGVEIMLFSPEFKIEYDDDGNPLEPDKYNQLLFSINTTEKYKLEAGTFNFEEDSDELHAFKRGILVLNALEGEGDAIHTVKSGSITVKENNGVYEISWDLTDESGKKITGKFKGEITDWRTTGFVS